MDRNTDDPRNYFRQVCVNYLGEIFKPDQLFLSFLEKFSQYMHKKVGMAMISIEYQ